MPDPRTKVDASAHTLDLTGVEGLLRWSELFGDDRPVEIEVGSGKGLFLQNAATLRPDHNFVGIELAKKYARKAAERAAKWKLRNVKVWPGDAKRFLARHVPGQSLQAVHVYFPDPWWKSRHKKRRVFNETLVADVERTLIPGGELHVATDVEEYFGMIQRLVAEHPRFERMPVPETKDAETDLDYLTNFERKYRIEGRPIYRVQYRLSDQGV